MPNFTVKFYLMGVVKHVDAPDAQTARRMVEKTTTEELLARGEIESTAAGVASEEKE